MSGAMTGRDPLKGTLRVVAYFGIAFHFLMILAVVTHADEWMVGKSIWESTLFVINRYSMITFSNRNFGFFAPSVTPDWNLRVMSVTESGVRQEYHWRVPSREMEVKMYSMLGHFGESADTMDLFARSWAVYVMNDQRSVVRVEIEVTRNYIPSMREFRKGRRVEHRPYYRTVFEFQ